MSVKNADYAISLKSSQQLKQDTHLFIQRGYNSSKYYTCRPPFLLFDENKIKMARKPGQKQKENPIACTEEGKRWKGNIRERNVENDIPSTNQTERQKWCPHQEMIFLTLNAMNQVIHSVNNEVRSNYNL